jgi:hypothetical protein
MQKADRKKADALPGGSRRKVGQVTGGPPIGKFPHGPKTLLTPNLILTLQPAFHRRSRY